MPVPVTGLEDGRTALLFILIRQEFIQLFINGLQCAGIGNGIGAVQQFINHRNGQFVGVHMHFYIMQNAGEVLHAAKVARTAG